MRPGKCEVCENAKHKYRCPKCEMKYCSLNCYKSHKEICSVHSAESKALTTENHLNVIDNDTPVLSRDTVKSQQAIPSTVRDDDKEDGEINDRDVAMTTTDENQSDHVTKECLRSLRDSSELSHLLSNPHLRAMLTSLDASSTPDKSIGAAMREPIFTEFADACLKIVEPERDATTLRLQRSST